MKPLKAGDRNCSCGTVVSRDPRLRALFTNLAAERAATRALGMSAWLDLVEHCAS